MAPTPVSCRFAPLFRWWFFSYKTNGIFSCMTGSVWQMSDRNRAPDHRHAHPQYRPQYTGKPAGKPTGTIIVRAPVYPSASHLRGWQSWILSLRCNIATAVSALCGARFAAGERGAGKLRMADERGRRARRPLRWGWGWLRPHGRATRRCTRARAQRMRPDRNVRAAFRRWPAPPEFPYNRE